MSEIWRFWYQLWSFICLYLIAIPCLLSQIIYKTRRPREIDKPVPSGTVAIVTGGSTGIGFHICKQLASLGAHVIMGVRNQVIGMEAVTQIKSLIPAAKVEAMELDLASFASVQRFATEFLERKLPLNILINNAAVMLTPHRLTVDGWEEQLQVNYLSHVLLTELLLERLISSGRPGRCSRIVSTSSHAHYVGRLDLDDLSCRESRSSHFAYSQSKLALLLYSNLLNKRLTDEGHHVTSNCVHPGVVDTDLFRYTSRLTRYLSKPLKWMYKTPEEGSYTSLFAALAPSLESEGGRYFDNCQEVTPQHRASDQRLQMALWSASRQALGLDN